MIRVLDQKKPPKNIELNKEGVEAGSFSQVIGFSFLTRTLRENANMLKQKGDNCHGSW